MTLAELKQIIIELMKPLHIDLDDLAYVKERQIRVLRVTIDKPDGITLDDCVAVSETISPELDRLDPFPEPYQLEVTSPGAERPLRSPEAIQKAIGKYIHVETDQMSMEGTLEAFDGETLTLCDTKNHPHVFSVSTVKKIRLAIKF